MMNLKKEYCKTKAFSLIELSIVLIIISLLVAGVVGGASLIKSAELRSIMTESNKYKLAINSYYILRDELPGDSNVESDGTANNMVVTDEGDSNGKIEALSASSEIEGTEAWNDMSDPDVGIIGMAQIFPLPNITTGRVPALTLSQMAPSKFKGAGWTLDYATTPPSGGEGEIATINANVLVFTGATLRTPIADIGNPVELIPNMTIKGIDAYSIDKKIDDGNFASGRVFGLNTEDNIPGTYGDPCFAEEKNEVCALAFKIGL